MKSKDKNLVVLLIVAFTSAFVITYSLGWVLYNNLSWTIEENVFTSIMVSVSGIVMAMVGLVFYSMMKDKFVDVSSQLVDDLKPTKVKVNNVKKTSEELKIEEINRQFRIMMNEPEQKLDDVIGTQITLDAPVIKKVEEEQLLKAKMEEEKFELERLMSEAPTKLIDNRQSHLKVAILERLTKDIEEGKIEIVPEQQTIDSANIEKITFKLYHKKTGEVCDVVFSEKISKEDEELLPKVFKPKREEVNAEVSLKEVEPKVVEEKPKLVIEEEPRKRGRGRIKHLRDEPLSADELNEELSRYDEGL